MRDLVLAHDAVYALPPARDKCNLSATLEQFTDQSQAQA
jgi:hypothetical protein